MCASDGVLDVDGKRLTKFSTRSSHATPLGSKCPVLSFVNTDTRLSFFWSVLS